MRTNIFLIIIGIILLHSCIGRQIDCPEFNNEILEWIPYEESDSITLFNSSDSSVLTLSINKVFIKHTTHYMTDEDCGTCDDFIEINDYHAQEANIHINIYLNENHIKSEAYTINGSYFNNSYSNKYVKTNYIFNGITYDDVKIFENKLSDDVFTKLIIAKKHGIIGLEDNDGNTWILNSTNLESFDAMNLIINNISCG